jgi:hypothetical protein
MYESAWRMVEAILRDGSRRDRYLFRGPGGAAATGTGPPRRGPWVYLAHLPAAELDE